ncbi:MAG: imidazolonepropionase [Streptosporangiales bacterium]|nr:imidazolonepropionase [Streptosporangiales bacterium]
MSRLLTNIARLWTGDGDPLDDAAVLVEDGVITWIGSAADAPAADIVDDCAGGLVTPGFIDAHTHPVYAGDRSAEIAARSAGATYAEIAAMGGGIASTVEATRAEPWDGLSAALRARLRDFIGSGTTTLEAKTGYHLTREGELQAVRMLADLADEPVLPRLSVTFLAAHALPPEYADSQDVYTTEVASWCRAAADSGADNIDVFCDEGHFTVDQAREVLQAGMAAGLRPRIHADELARTGGSLLAAELGCLSADHLLKVTEEDAAALAAADVTAVVCPGTALQMRTAPPVRMLLDHGVTVALGTDHNPGQCGSTSMSLMISLAVAAFRMSVTEALHAATVGAARALGVQDRGVVRVGALGDLVWWNAAHEGAFAWAFRLEPRQVWRAGVPVLPADLETL